MVSFVGADSGGGNVATIINLDWPTVQDDDVAFVFWIMQNTVTPTIPSGWTVPTGGAQDASSGSGRMRFMWHICDGTESGALNLTNDTATVNRQAAVLKVYRGLDTTNPVDGTPQHHGEIISGTTHASPSVITGVADAVILAAAGERSTNGTTGWTAPSGYTERADSTTLATGNGGTIVAGADDGLASGRASGSVVTPGVWTSTNGFSTANVQTWTVSLKPLAATAKTLTDTGSGADALTLTVAVALSDTTAAGDVLVAAAALAVTDAGSAADTLSAAVTADLSDASTAADELDVTITGELVDAGAAADQLTVEPAVPLAETSSAADTFTSPSATPLTEVAGAADALSITVQADLADTAAGTDVLSIGTPIPLADLASAADALSVTVLAGLTETAAGLDALALAVDLTLPDAVGADDALSLPQTPELTEAVAAVDALLVTGEASRGVMDVRTRAAADTAGRGRTAGGLLVADRAGVEISHRERAGATMGGG